MAQANYFAMNAYDITRHEDFEKYFSRHPGKFLKFYKQLLEKREKKRLVRFDCELFNCGSEPCKYANLKIRLKSLDEFLKDMEPGRVFFDEERILFGKYIYDNGGPKNMLAVSPFLLCTRLCYILFLIA